MKELKLRTFSNTIEAQIWQAFGVETTALPIRQVSLALKEGVVDAEENPISVIEAYRFYVIVIGRKECVPLGIVEINRRGAAQNCG